MRQQTALIAVYKFILFSFVGIFFCFNQISCSKKVKEKENIELIIKIEDTSNQPIPFTIITVDKIEKSIIRYFWEYHEVLETEVDKNGLVKIKIDGISRYRIKVYYQDQAGWFCSEEFESSEINYDDGIYVIKCVAPSHEQNEKDVERKNADEQHR